MNLSWHTKDHSAWCKNYKVHLTLPYVSIKVLNTVRYRIKVQKAGKGI